MTRCKQHNCTIQRSTTKYFIQLFTSIPANTTNIIQHTIMTTKATGEHDHSNVGSKKSSYTLSGAGLKNEGRNDKRSRRIINAGIFIKGVKTYRSQLFKVTPSAKETPPKPFALSRVLARPRPLFQYEAKAGEWDSLTRMPQGGVVLHEGTEQVKHSQGVFKVLRHHIFDKVEAVSTDAELYHSTRDLLSQAVRGKMSTIFMYGMTGSGKTYSMATLHRKFPVDLFAQINAAKPGAKATVRFHAYELLGKRCFDLADRKATKAEVATRTEVFLRVDSEGRTNMCGMAEHEVESPDALLELLHLAVSRRETSATGANATSSRSHAVYVRVPSNQY